MYINLEAPDNAAGTKYGYSLDISGNYAVIGAYQDLQGFQYRGACHLFEKVGNTWNHVKKILPTNTTQSDQAGWSVAIDGNWMVMGSHGNDGAGLNAGAIDIWKRENGQWVFSKKIYAQEPTPQEQFGIQVELSGNWLFVASANDQIAYNAGAVYCYRFENNDWVFKQKLVPRQAWASSAVFGNAISSSGNLLVIGANKAYPNNVGEAGIAVIYKLNAGSWEKVQEIRPSNSGRFDEFGKAVHTDGTNVIVGSWNHNNNRVGGISGHGGAFIFSPDSNGVYNEVAWLRKPNPVYGDYFGYSVAISGNLAIVGVPNDSDVSRFSGSVYRFRKQGNTWTLFDIRRHSNLQNYRFGWKVALSANKTAMYSTNVGKVFLEEPASMSDPVNDYPEMPAPNIVAYTQYGGNNPHPVGVPIQPGEDVRFVVLLGIPPGAPAWPGGGVVRITLPGLPSPVEMQVPNTPVNPVMVVGEFHWTPTDAMQGQVVIGIEYQEDSPDQDTSGTSQNFTIGVRALAGDINRDRKVDVDDLVVVQQNWTR